MNDKFNSYWYVCHNCDASIEVVSKGIHFQDPACNCNNSQVVWCQTSVVESGPNQTKEEPMETTQALALQEMIQKKDEYIVRLQNEISSLTEKIGPNHQNCDYWKSENGRIGQQLISLINNSYDEDADASDILESICQIIDYSPVKTIQFEGVIHFSGSMDVHRSELDGFDLTSALEDVYVDINNGDVVIDNYELYSAEEPY